MKRIIIILTVLVVNIAAYANECFDPTINYQYNNAKAYIGETLYLIPISNSWYSKKVSECYNNFLSYEFDEDDYYASEYTTSNNYKFDPFDYRDYKVAGTHYRHIEGHKFYVNNVVPFQDKEYTWIFYLTDLNTGDKLKFAYHGNPEIWMFAFTDFPFITMKYYNYCKSLIGTDLVYATHGHKFQIIENENIYDPTFKDIYTDETVYYAGNYAKWKIINAFVDDDDLCISFIVTNGLNTIKIPYNIQYSTETKQPEYFMAKYSSGVRVFPEAQWNKMVNKYGIKHMSLIMNTEISNDMTVEEKYLAGGKKLGKATVSNNSNNSTIKQIGNSTLQSTKDAINTHKEIVKGLISAFL